MATPEVTPDQTKRIYWIGGSKGGVGKSMVTMAVLDVFTERAEDVLLVECDTSNADTWKAYAETIPAELINLDEADGWIHLVNLCDERKESTVVMNTAARNNLAVTKFGSTLDTTLAELKRQLVALWVINRQRDSLELLREFYEAMPHAIVHVLRNAHFGEGSKFELYNGSKMREEIERRGGRSVTFPDVADRVADDVYSKRLSLAAASTTLPLGNRAELARWRAEVRRALGDILA
jgi:hypothetical protein